ncbi:MAG TPA: LacI family transcriptional regulator [Bacteroides sp.]|nr:LacI family transcriptional regulator [Bacteroides sp.]
MKKQHITIHDIARELNISASTVSRALHNHPRISKATREAVQQMALKYNYQPNVMASSLRKGKSRTVGVIVPRINRNFFANVIGGMEEILSSAGYHLIICQTLEKVNHEIFALRALINARVDAIIISISMETKNYEHLRILLDQGIRVLFFDRICEEIKTGSVAIDDRLGAYQSVRHLIDQGYRNIAHVAGADHISIYRARKAGYLEAMHEAGIDVREPWIFEESLVPEGGKTAFEKGMKLQPRPDAYFCAGDFAALGILKAARDQGLKVPADIGVTGFANEPFTEFTEPSLTTVDQRAGEMGRMVADMFLKEVDLSQEKRSLERIVLKPELIVRNSSILNR